MSSSWPCKCTLIKWTTCLSRDARQGEKAMVAAGAAVAVVLQLSRAEVLGSCWCVFEELAGLDGKQRFVAGWTASAEVDNTLATRQASPARCICAARHRLHPSTHHARRCASDTTQTAVSVPTPHTQLPLAQTSSQTHTHTWAHARRAACERSMWKYVTRQRKIHAPESGHRHASHGGPGPSKSSNTNVASSEQ